MSLKMPAAAIEKTTLLRRVQISDERRSRLDTSLSASTASPKKTHPRRDNTAPGASTAATLHHEHQLNAVVVMQGGNKIARPHNDESSNRRPADAAPIGGPTVPPPHAATLHDDDLMPVVMQAGSTLIAATPINPAAAHKSTTLPTTDRSQP